MKLEIYIHIYNISISKDEKKTFDMNRTLDFIKVKKDRTLDTEYLL